MQSRIVENMNPVAGAEYHPGGFLHVPVDGLLFCGEGIGEGCRGGAGLVAVADLRVLGSATALAVDSLDIA